MQKGGVSTLLAKLMGTPLYTPLNKGLNPFVQLRGDVKIKKHHTPLKFKVKRKKIVRLEAILEIVSFSLVLPFYLRTINVEVKK